ncbi:hypothetical protein [Pedobacter sp. JY14-1]|uniref:hypothetical protein n=1 Tax=Pedobacter sp. JY14-1 TaxID=3034151 RepID=UPI0023E19B9D|nr:hypothetical protein [Pedobacter sp. JY14-1]
MEIATYVVYELLIRLQALTPNVGVYLSSSQNPSGVLLKTTTGTIHLPIELLKKQFEEPSLITETDIINLLSNFRVTASA